MTRVLALVGFPRVLIPSNHDESPLVSRVFKLINKTSQRRCSRCGFNIINLLTLVRKPRRGRRGMPRAFRPGRGHPGILALTLGCRESLCRSVTLRWDSLFAMPARPSAASLGLASLLSRTSIGVDVAKSRTSIGVDEDQHWR